MNIKWVIIGVIFMIAAVVFGRSPINEAHKAKEESMKGKDALVESIKEHNTKGLKFGSILSGKGGTATPAPVAPAPSSRYPSYMMRQQGSTGAAQPSSAQPPAQQQAPPQPESYYPPPPLNQ